MHTDGKSQGVEERALQDFPNEEAGGWECQKVLRDWFPQLRERAGQDAEYRRAVWDAVEVLKELRLAFCADEDWEKPQPRGRLWRWPSENAALTPPEPSWFSVEHLDSALSGYLKRPWLQHNAIDLSAMNALLFTELSAFAEQVRVGAIFGATNWSYLFSGGSVLKQLGLAIFGQITKFIAAWIMLPVVAITFMAYGQETSAFIAVGLWTVYVLYRLLTLPARLRLQKARRAAAEKAQDMLRTMMAAWAAARGRTINPSRLKELVREAEDRGVVYRPVLHTLINRAMHRDPAAMIG